MAIVDIRGDGSQNGLGVVDASTKEIIDDGASLYIRVETTDSVNTSGGYMAGYDDNADSRRFAKAREMIENAIK